MATPTPIEMWEDGGTVVAVKREDLYDPGFANGKLRGVLPWLERNDARHATALVDHSATHSNSHALTAYCGQRLGVPVICYTNTKQQYVDRHPALVAAKLRGADVVGLGTMHLGPLRVNAERRAPTGSLLVPWAWSTPDIVRDYATAVAEVPKGMYDTHVVPFGGAGWTAGVLLGLLEADRTDEYVVAAVAMPTNPANDWRRLEDMLPPWALQRAVGRVDVHYPDGRRPTPWLTDPRFEWPAWHVAVQQAQAGRRVLFWNIGKADYDLGARP